MLLNSFIFDFCANSGGRNVIINAATKTTAYNSFILSFSIMTFTIPIFPPNQQTLIINKNHTRYIFTYSFLPQHFLYFLPLPQGHLSLGYIFIFSFSASLSISFTKGSSSRYMSLKTTQLSSAK